MKWLRTNAGVITVLASIVVSAIVATHVIDGEIAQQSSALDAKINTLDNTLNGKIGDINIHVTKLDGAVKTLGDQQSDPLKQIIHDLLSSAQSALPQNPDVAQRAIRVANSLIATLRQDKRPADNQYFESTVSAINNLRLKARQPSLLQAVYSTGISLAEYRSALQPIPKIPEQSRSLNRSVLPDSSQGSTLVMTAPEPFFIFQGGDNRVSTITLFGASEGVSQVLDGVHWTDVTFVNVHIIYRGGPVELQGIRFINCTFDFPSNNNGAEIASRVALNQTVIYVAS